MKNELIQIKPKNIFSLISKTFSLYFRFFPQIFSIVILSFLVSNFAWSLATADSLLVKIVGVTIILISFPCSLISGWTIYKVTMQAYCGEVINWKAAFCSAKENFVSCLKNYLTITALLISPFLLKFFNFYVIDYFITNSFLISVLQFAIMFAAIYCINTALNICLAFPVTFVEGVKGYAGWKRSKELVKGSKMRLLATFLLSFILMFVGVLAVSTVFIFLDLGFSSKIIYNFAGGFASFTIPILYTLFYYDIIARKQLQSNA